MTQFADAIVAENNTSFTQNGALTNASSLSPHVDLFFQIGASRGKDLSKTFERAYQTDRELALRVLLWARDVRGGAGERQTFRNLLCHLEREHFEDALLVMPHVPTFGRWDDLLAFRTPEIKHAVAGMVGRALRNKDALCAKWMPRKGKTAYELRTALGMSPKQWRKTLVGLTSVVETKMCSNEWDAINFEHVPSVAASRYRKAFMRRANESYTNFVERLTKGEAKINASAIFPHDVLRDYLKFIGSWGSRRVDPTEKASIKAQWDALPNLLGDQLILPMVDVSESMYSDVGGVRAIDVSIALGAYLADKQKGPMSDCFLTFTDRPTLTRVSGDIFEKIDRMNARKGYSTNFEAAYREVLRVAVQNKIEPENMPEYLLVLSDMEFNRCDRNGHSIRLFDAAKAEFEAAGYKLPRMVFWNLNARPGNSPVTFREDGTALVSGYSQNILKGIMAADLDNFTPEAIMLKTVMTDRYNIFN